MVQQLHSGLFSESMEEDTIIQLTCRECDADVDVDEDECGDCGSDDLTKQTSHEDVECMVCKTTFEMDEPCYHHLTNSQLYICESCHEDLEA